MDELWEHLKNARDFEKWLCSLSNQEQDELYGHPLESEFEFLLRFKIPP